MNGTCTTRIVAAALAGLCAAGPAACSGLGTGGAPTTQGEPLSTQEMCTRGENAYRTIDELDRTKPDYLDRVKAAIEPLGSRPPEEIADDIRAWVRSVMSASDAGELGSPPAGMEVSIARIDDWWRRNCGKPLIAP